MKTWLRAAWSAVGDTLWFLPAVFTFLSAVFAVALLALEREGRVWSGEPPWWLYQGGADDARTVLNVITGSLITVTGVVFAVTIVAVQLASSQYTPRMMRNFSSDRGNQVVLGIFIGTFTFGVLVLRSVRGEVDGSAAVVPRLAVTVAIVLVLASVAALIYFINHVTREIHVTAILDRISQRTRNNIHQLFPEHVGHADTDPPLDLRQREPEANQVCATRAGYLHVVNEERLFDLGERARMVIRMEHRIGDYVLQGRPLASVWAATGSPAPDLEDAIRRAFVLGLERTPEQDVEFGLIQISDIAIKALSPSINDPTTAIRCIDRLAELLAEFGTRNPPAARRTREGRICFVASYTTFDSAVKVAYDEIRHFGAPVPIVARHLLDTLHELLKLVPASRHEPLVSQAQAVLHTAQERISNPRDKADIERAAERMSRTLGFDVEGAVGSR